MQTFIDIDPLVWAAAGAAFLMGGLLTGLLVWTWMKLHWQRSVLTARNRQAHLESRSAELLERNETLKTRLDQQQQKFDSQQQEIVALVADRAAAKEQALRLPVVERHLSEACEQIEILRQENAAHMTKLAELNTLIDQERQQADEKVALLMNAREQLSAEFQNLAHKIFEDKSRKFGEQNREQIDTVLVPLREQINNFRRKVEDVYDHESRDRISLLTEIQHLKELNRRIGKDAVNLTQALKGDSKARGNWGEVVLARVLENSGLTQGREYELQVSLENSDKRRYQPDVIVRLPDGKDVVVDAKVSLNAYERFFNAEEKQAREKALKEHIESMRIHIRGLGEKSYQDLAGIRSLDFVLLFVPVEAAFLTALEKDTDLFQWAFEKNIILVSPATLLIALRTIHNIWRYEYQSRNAREIAQRAGNLYDKFVGFVSALEEIGRQLDRAREAYGSAHNRLTSGRGNLITRVQGLIQLGVKARKELPQELLEPAMESENASEDLK